MTKMLLLGLAALAVISAVALASRPAPAPRDGAPGAAQVADAPSARDIFPKVLNR
ncbi:hypothetical protein KF840_02235 [bacterium]|nr:hypothetical protein [bacterium]